jgi:hypothetical protein
MQSGGGGGGSSSRQPLHALPKGPRTLPSVKSWRAWVDAKLASWRGLQSAGFAGAVQLALNGPNLDASLAHDSAANAKSNKASAFELCGLADEELCL